MKDFILVLALGLASVLESQLMFTTSKKISLTARLSRRCKVHR